MDSLFRKRIGLAQNKVITFDVLDKVLEKMAHTIPFENLAVIEHRTKNITKENLVEKILINNEGGLCYDLNLTLHFFLVENGFRPVLTEAVMYNRDTEEYRGTTGTHLVNLVTHRGQMYLVDAGFGGNVPLKPVPFSGETVASDNGEFRVGKVDTGPKDYVFEMKLRHGNLAWTTGYAIDPENLITDISELDKTQKIIVENADSPFNKDPFITRLTAGGYLKLTQNTFTRCTDGVILEDEIDERQFGELLKQHFGLQLGGPHL